MMEMMDETAAKIMLAATPGDSINRVAQKIDGTYSWVHEWVSRLEEKGFIEREDGIRITDYAARDRFNDVMAVISTRDPPTIDEAYIIPHFSLLPFAFTQIDAVYCWTAGGYQVGRNESDYPIFITVLDRDTERWQQFFGRYGIPTSIEYRPKQEAFDRAVRFVLFPTEDFDREWVNGRPVLPLEQTVEHMLAYRPQYEPALEIIAAEYDIDIEPDIQHRDVDVGGER